MPLSVMISIPELAHVNDTTYPGNTLEPILVHLNLELE